MQCRTAKKYYSKDKGTSEPAKTPKGPGKVGEGPAGKPKAKAKKAPKKQNA